jgi:hypothetical protein
MAYVAPTAFSAAPFGYPAGYAAGYPGVDTTGFFAQQSVGFAQQPVYGDFSAPIVSAPVAYPQEYIQQPVVYQQPVEFIQQPAVVYEQPPVIYEQPIVQPVFVQPPTVVPAPTITNRGPPNVPVPTWTRKRDPSYAHPELFLTGVGNGMFQQFRSKKENSRYPFHHPGI